MALFITVLFSIEFPVPPIEMPMPNPLLLKTKFPSTVTPLPVAMPVFQPNIELPEIVALPRNVPVSPAIMPTIPE